MSGSRDYDLTEGSLPAPLVGLSAPIVFTQLLHVVYNLVDTFWVGRLGQDAVEPVLAGLEDLVDGYLGGKA